MEKDGETVVLPLVVEYIREDRKLDNNTDSEDFTSDSDAIPESSSESGSNEDAFVIMHIDEVEEKDSKEKEVSQQIEEKTKHLDDKLKRRVRGLLEKEGLIALSLDDLRPSKVPVKHSFELKDYTPIYHKPRRMPPTHNVIVKAEIEKMLRAGIIRPISSEWSFPVVIATKKDGKPRFCIDYRLLNQRMFADRWPLPKQLEIFDEMKSAVVFTGLDFFTGYWQFLMALECATYTTFTCRYGTYAWNVMPMGLMNAPSTFQRAMDKLLGDLPFVRVYLDDIIVFSESIEEHLEHLEVVLDRISKYNLKIKIAKCHFLQPEIELLGHLVSAEGVKVDPKKIEKIQNIPIPTNVTEVRSFLGLAGYYRRFIYNFAGIATPLHTATSVKRKFAWDEEMDQSFQKLKKAMTSPPVLAYPDFEKPFIVETDASKVGVSAVLTQKNEKGEVHPVQFTSRTMTPTERNYSACDRETLAVIFGLRQYRVYLLSTEPFTLITDHKALKNTFKKKDVHGRLARWLDFLAEYEYVVQHRPGKDNIPPDFLSRIDNGPAPPEDQPDEGELCLFLGAVAEEDVSGWKFEDRLLDVYRYLSDMPYQLGDAAGRRLVRKSATQFVLWDGQMFRRTKNGLRIILSIPDRVRALRFFHDELGHWSAKATAKFVTDRYWWPNVVSDVYKFVRSCDACQRMSRLPSYKTTLKRPITNLFEVYSIDFAGPIRLSADGKERHILVCVEHMSNWPIAKITESTTSKAVIDFISEEIIPQFGPPKTVVSDNASCFTSKSLAEFMKRNDISWKTVLAYAPMSNGRAERMVGTLKSCIGRLCESQPRNWMKKLSQAVYGYRRRAMDSGVSPFELMYGVPPRLVSTDPVVGHEVGEEGRRLESLAALSVRASRSVGARDQLKKPKKDKEFEIGQRVLVAHGRAFTTTSKWPVFTSKYYGPCTIVGAQHPRYVLKSSSGRFTRKSIHARRLLTYQERPEHLQ